MEGKNKKIVNAKSIIISAIVIVLVVAFIVYLRADSKIQEFATTPEKTTMNATVTSADTDSDHDGYPDKTDPEPKIKNVGLRDLAIFASLTYDYGTPYIGKMYAASDIKGFNGVKIGQNYYWHEPSEDYYFYHFASASEVSDWTIVDSVNIPTKIAARKNALFSATTYKYDNNIVIAYRGTDFDDPLEWMQDLSYGLFNYQGQEIQTRKYADKIFELYKDCDNCKIYITGHSLGGYLAQIGGAEMYKDISALKASSSKGPTLEQIAYFDGMGLGFNQNLPAYIQNETKQLLTQFYNEGKDQAGYNADKLALYFTNGDPVSSLGTHLGSEHGYPASPIAAAHHNGDFDRIKADAKLNYNVDGYHINWGKIFTWLGAHKIINEDKSIGEYFDQYKADYGLNNIIDYVWTAHETDSLLYNISQGTRSWQSYQKADNIKPRCIITYPLHIKLGKTAYLKLECYDTDKNDGTTIVADLTDKKITNTDIVVPTKTKGIFIEHVEGPSLITGKNPPHYEWKVRIRGIRLGSYYLQLKPNIVRDRSSNGNNGLTTRKPVTVSLR